MKKIPLMLTIPFTLLLLLVGSSWFVAGKLIETTNHPITDIPKNLNASNILIDDRIAAWDCATKNSEAVIILCHGIRSSRNSMVNRAKVYNDAGYSTILIDLQAHGETIGESITVGYLEQNDVKSAVSYAKAKYPQQKILISGVSLGGASAVLGSPLDVDGIILESVYSTLEKAVHNRVEHRLGKMGWLPAELLLAQVSLRLGFSKDELRPIDNLSQLNCPVFIISGSNDYHTTVDETKSMFQQAIEPKQLWIVEGASHEDLYKFSPEIYKDKVLSFVHSIVSDDV